MDSDKGRDRVIHAIESTRLEMTECLRRAGYCFYDVDVIKLSRKLDRLLNLYYRMQNRRGKLKDLL